MGTRRRMLLATIAPALAAQYSVVVTDLRGYGDSSKAPYSEANSNHCFRLMAQDQVEVMQ